MGLEWRDAVGRLVPTGCVAHAATGAPAAAIARIGDWQGAMKQGYLAPQVSWTLAGNKIACILVTLCKSLLPPLSLNSIRLAPSTHHHRPDDELSLSTPRWIKPSFPPELFRNSL